MKESLGQYATRGGKLLSYRKWRGTKDVIVYLHGIESNSAWFSSFASRLNESEFTIYGIDRRGSGLNEEKRGDIDDYNVFLDDIDNALRFVREQNTGKKIYLMGICWGALLVVNYVVKRDFLPDGIILLSPAIYRKINFNLCIRTLAKMCFFIRPETCFKIPIKDNMFTSNKRYLDFIRRDSRRLRSLSVRFFSEILRMERECYPDNRKITLPVLAVLAGHDEIVDNEKIHEWFNGLETNDKTIKVFDNFHHVMPFEEDIDSLIDFISGWIGERELSFERQSIED